MPHANPIQHKGRPDKSRPYFPQTSAQKAARTRRADKKGGVRTVSEMVVGAILRADATQLPRLLDSFHTLDSRVRTLTVALLREAGKVRLSKEFASRFQR